MPRFLGGLSDLIKPNTLFPDPIVRLWSPFVGRSSLLDDLDDAGVEVALIRDGM